jgi:uncharacterized protein with PIN domain
MTMAVLVGLLLVAGSVVVMLVLAKLVRYGVERVYQQPYVADHRYTVTHESDGRDRLHPKHCRCPQCRARVAAKRRAGKKPPVPFQRRA